MDLAVNGALPVLVGLEELVSLFGKLVRLLVFLMLDAFHCLAEIFEDLAPMIFPSDVCDLIHQVLAERLDKDDLVDGLEAVDEWIVEDVEDLLHHVSLRIHHWLSFLSRNCLIVASLPSLDL